MSVKPTCLLEPTLLLAIQTTQYVAPANGQGVIIDKFTLLNTDTVTQTVSVNLVPLSGAAAATNLVLKTKSLGPGEAYTCPEVVGQILSAGDFVSTATSTDNKVTLRISGRLLT